MPDIVRRHDQDFSFLFEGMTDFQRTVIVGPPACHGFGGIGIFFQHQPGQADIVLWFPVIVLRTGQDHHDPGAAVPHRFSDRDRICHASVKIASAADRVWFIENGDAGGSFHRSVVVLLHIFFVEIMRPPGICIRRHNDKFAGGSRHGFVIQRIFSSGVAQHTVYIVQIDIIPGLEEVFPAHILIPEGILHVKLIVPVRLIRQKRCNVGTAGGYPVASVKRDFLLHAPVEHSGSIDISHSSADINYPCH